MSEPVIPARYKLQHSGFVGVLENGSEDGNGFVELLVIKLIEELGAAESQVAEQAATIAARESLLDRLNAANEARAAVIERLTHIKGTIDHRLNNHLCNMKPEQDDSITGFNEAWDVVRKAFCDAALSKEAQP